MKKLLALAVLILASGSAFAAPRSFVTFDSVIGPATVTNAVNISSGTNPVYIPAPAQGTRNCLTDLYVSGARTSVPVSFQVNVLDGPTTSYVMDASTAGVINKTWPPEDPWCASPGRTLGITATSNALAPNTLSLDVSYKGYSY